MLLGCCWGPHGLEGTEGVGGQGSSHSLSQEWGSWSTGGSPSPKHQAPPWGRDDSSPAGGGSSHGLAGQVGARLYQKQLLRAGDSAAHGLSQQCWQPLPALQRDGGCSWLHQLPQPSQPNPQEGDAPRALAQVTRYRRHTLLLFTSMASHSFSSCSPTYKEVT